MGSNQKTELDFTRDETLWDRGFFRSLLKPDSFYFYYDYGRNRSLKANTDVSPESLRPSAKLRFLSSIDY